MSSRFHCACVGFDPDAEEEDIDWICQKCEQGKHLCMYTRIHTSAHVREGIMFIIQYILMFLCNLDFSPYFSFAVKERKRV